MKKVFVITLIVVFAIGGVFYFAYSSETRIINKSGYGSETNSEQFVVQISNNDITERDIIELIGVKSLLGISDGYYQLLLTDNQYETIITENIKHKKLPLASPQAVDDMSTYTITIKEPVINSKVQELANYGSIIEKISENKYTMWVSKSNINSIQNLIFISQTSPYFLHERLEPSLIAINDSSVNINVVMKVLLPNDNTLEKIMTAVVKNGGQNVTQYKSDIVSKSLDSLNLEVIIPADKIYKLVQDNPEIVIIRVKQ